MSAHRIIYLARNSQHDFATATATYVKRSQAWLRLELIRLRPATPSLEAKSILKHIEPHHHVIALDERGEQWSSLDFASKIKQSQHNQQPTCWVVGAHAGLPDAIKTRANTTLSLSRCTLPHQLALTLLSEQIYRACCINAGTPYHRGE
jgi:23S rRNA (pseudouridine1915-N3)-methyltransferase